MNYDIQAASLISSSYGPAVCRIITAALDAVDPQGVIRNNVRLEENRLIIAGKHYVLSPNCRIIVISVGKASVGMAKAIIGILGDRITKGLIVTKNTSTNIIGNLEIIQAGHPVPDIFSQKAGKKVIELLSGLTDDDIVICLISGGSSALLAAPVDGLSLVDIQTLTESVLECGASIDEINIIRRQTDLLKGGGLMGYAKPARIVGLILSDVIHDKLETIGSGLTTPDPSSPEEAIEILDHYKITHHRLRSILNSAANSSLDKKISTAFVHNAIVGNNLKAAQAAISQAEHEGFNPYLVRVDQRGEASLAAQHLSRYLRWAKHTDQPVPVPGCMVVGGETTVTLHSSRYIGRGGRNTELALASVVELANFPDVMLVTLATDGEDGQTDAAGAVVTGESLKRAYALGLDPVRSLRYHDSYTFFEKLNDLIKTGPTGTNVNDLTFLFTFQS